MILMTLWLLVMTCRVCKASSESCTTDGTSLLTVRDAEAKTTQDPEIPVWKPFTDDGLCQAVAGEHGTKFKINRLGFNCESEGWSAASIEWKVFYAVTHGQPVPEQCLGTSFTDIFFLAGRKKSKLIRDTFMDHVDPSQTLNSLNHRSMNKLNFALMVTLSFGSASTIDPIRIGQGSSFFKNDWWIGGEGCKRKCFYEDTDGSEKFILQCGELCFSPTGDLDASRFDVKRVPCCWSRFTDDGQCRASAGREGTQLTQNVIGFNFRDGPWSASPASSVAFDPKFYLVTHGQPVRQRCLDISGSEISFFAGRQKSAMPGNVFMEGLDCNKTMSSLKQDCPGKLNFVFEGKLTLHGHGEGKDGASTGICLAQRGEELSQDSEPLEDQFPVHIRYPKSADKLITELTADSFPLTLIFKEYQVNIDTSGTGSGAPVEETFFVNEAGKVVVRDDVGVAARWKDSSTDVCLHPGDWIIEANSVSVDPEGILRELAKGGQLQVRVQQQGSIFKTDVFNSQDDMRNRLQSQAKPKQLQLLRQHAKGLPLLCVCGGKLQEIGLRERVHLLVEPKGENGVLTYAGRRFTVDQIIEMHAVTCDLCRKAVERTARLWTCGNGANTILHAQSYDICQQCFQTAGGSAGNGQVNGHTAAS
ncbi:unnamed protein product [Symbiodinium sp. CCMP2592]|nr:unnamed protein product [Symbiodinium sp. CCMP2592]